MGARLGGKNLGTVVPYGVKGAGGNAGWGSLGITSATVAFAVNAIRMWRAHPAPGDDGCELRRRAVISL